MSDFEAARKEADLVLEAIGRAIKRITSDQACMRIPAEPYADPDIVLAKCRATILVLLAEVDRLKAELAAAVPAARFVELLEPDPAERADILKNPSFWAVDYAHALEKLGDVTALLERAGKAEAKLAAEREKREQAEHQCETVSREHIRLQEVLAAERERAEGARMALDWYDAADRGKGCWCPMVRQFVDRRYSSGDVLCLGCKEWFDHDAHPGAIELEFLTRVREALRSAASDPTPSETIEQQEARHNEDRRRLKRERDEDAGSEQPDLPLVHEFVPCALMYCLAKDHCVCGQPESAHRRKP